MGANKSRVLTQRYYAHQALQKIIFVLLARDGRDLQTTFIGAMPLDRYLFKGSCFTLFNLIIFFCLPDRRHSLVAYALHHGGLWHLQEIRQVNPKASIFAFRQIGIANASI